GPRPEQGGVTAARSRKLGGRWVAAHDERQDARALRIIETERDAIFLREGEYEASVGTKCRFEPSQQSRFAEEQHALESSGGRVGVFEGRVMLDVVGDEQSGSIVEELGIGSRQL